MGLWQISNTRILCHVTLRWAQGCSKLKEKSWLNIQLIFHSKIQSLQLPYAFWGYRTLIPTSTGVTPYSLVYGMEAVLPIEMGVRSMRTILESEIPEVGWLQSRYDQLCMMDEKKLKALYHIQGYQRRLRKAFDKKVRAKDLKLGDLVLKEIRAPVQDTNRKFKQN